MWLIKTPDDTPLKKDEVYDPRLHREVSVMTVSASVGDRLHVEGLLGLRSLLLRLAFALRLIWVKSDRHALPLSLPCVSSALGQVWSKRIPGAV